MNSRRRSFRWTKMRFRRGLATSLVVLLILPLLLPAMALADGGGCEDRDAKYEPVSNTEPNVFNAPAGQVYEMVCIKAGNEHIHYTEDTAPGGDGHYFVSGIGTGTLTVEKVGEGPETKDISHIDVYFGPAPEEPTYDMTVEKTVDESTITVGDQTFFTITVTNTGNQPLEDVVVTDTIPEELEFVSSSPTEDGASSDPNYQWTFDLAPNGESGDAQVITVNVKGDSAGIYDNLAVAEALDGDEQTIHREDNAIGEVVEGEPEPTYGLDVEKTVNDATITVGDQTFFTITVTNTGNQALEDVVVTDTIPEELEFVSSSPTEDGASSDPNYQWTFDLAPNGESGDTQVITVNVKGVKVGGYTNTAVGSSFGGEGPGDEDSVDGEVVAEPPAQLDTSYTITKTDSVDPVIVGENTVYTITVTNTGETTLEDVSVNDTLPDGFEFVSADPAPNTISPLGWILPDLGPDDSYVIKVTAKAIAVGKWTNSAHVHVGEAPAVYADEDTEVTLLPPAALPEESEFDLSISKTDDVDPAYVGETVTYTVTVKNTGNETLTGLVFDDLLPSGLTFKSSNVGSLKAEDGVAVWSVAKLEPGETRTFRIATTAKEVGNWLNTVSVEANEIPTPREANEVTQVLAQVAQAPEASQPAQSGTLPSTGFPLTAWWMTSAIMLAAGMWLEITTRRRRKLVRG